MQADPNNPICQLRFGRRLDRFDFAASLGLPLSEVLAHEFGRPAQLSPRMRQALLRGGMDSRWLNAAYCRWRATSVFALRNAA
jgi:hypothetical protein